MDDKRKIMIRNKVIESLIEMCTSYGGLKDFFQDMIDEQDIKFNNEEEEYAYELIDKICEDEDIAIKIEEMLVDHFNEMI